MPPIDDIKLPKGDRFWDGFINQDLTTDDGFKAYLKPTLAGNSTAWMRKDLKVSIELSYGDGTKEIVDIAAGIVDGIRTSRNSDQAEITVANIAKPMQEAPADKVKDGASWYQNYPLSTLINELLHKVYKGPTGELPEDKRVNPENLVTTAPEGSVGFWNLGVAPTWDGANFEPSLTATPVTAMCTGVNENELFVALGGIDGTNPAELWLYNPDEDVWTKLGQTAQSIPIQQLFYNTYDNRIYGVLWKDIAESQTDVENTANKVNWFAPTAHMFEWDPFGELSTARIDDEAHTTPLGNIFPGTWDIREFYNWTYETLAGRHEIVGGMATTADTSRKIDQISTFKLDARASAGNYTAFKYVSMPYGALGRPTFLITPESRVGISRYYARASSNYEQDPLMAVWGNTAHGTAKGELIPTTSAGVTAWTGASGTTPPNGFTAATDGADVPSFSVTAGVLDIDHKQNTNVGLDLELTNLESKITTYRIRLDLVQNVQLFIRHDAPGGAPADADSQFMPFTDSYQGYSTAFINYPSDFYITLLTHTTLYLCFRPVGALSGNMQIRNVSMTVARHWDQWHDLSRQAAENIPITSFSKVVVGAHMRTQTHPANEGAGYNLFGASHLDDTTVRSISPVHSSKFSDEVFMELCLIGQDRRLLNSGTFPATHPMYGPNEAEDGVAPDNFIRERMLVDNYNVANTVGQEFNEARVFDLAPSVDPNFVGSAVPETYSRRKDGFAEANAFRSGRAGHGYLSVGLQTIGPRVTQMQSQATYNDDFLKSGMVRYTNGQQGLFVFSQEADQGKGMILLCRPDVGTVPDAQRFFWGPSNNNADGNRFKVKYSVFRCSNNSINDITGVPVERDLSDQVPLIVGADSWSPIYPNCGCVDGAGNFYVGAIEAKSQTALFTGSNQDDIISQSYLYKVAFGTGAYVATPTVTTIYSSLSDNSSYNEDGALGVYGNITNDYNGQSAVNKTRKFGWLNYNSGFNKPLTGWCFKRDSILSDPATVPAVPCHEVFAMDPTTPNVLSIVDHDIQDGNNPDAVGFLSFINTTGSFANISYPELTGKKVTWYIRQKKPTANPSKYYRVGYGIQLCYMYQDDSGNLIGGQFWDSDAETLSNVSLYREEGFLSHRHLIKATLDFGKTSQRETLFSSFDKVLSNHHLTRATRDEIGLSSRLFFKLDDYDVDPRIRLADFSGLQVWDAISKLSMSRNLSFGFDADKFFLIPNNRTSLTHSFQAHLGEIIDFEKETDSDIRNIISVQPYREQLGDITWEITHVGSEEVLADGTLFNGELVAYARTPKQASIDFICVRGTRVIADNIEYGENDELILNDANDEHYERDHVLFKWLTRNPTKEVTLMKTMNSDQSYLYVNTLYINSTSSISPGELVIFTNPTTFEQLGIVIDSIDSVLNRINLERSPGFEVEKFTPVTIVSANIGANNDGEPNYASVVRKWNNKFSDEGVTIVTTAPTLVSGKTILTVNNIIPFEGVNIAPYKEGNRYYPFLVSVYSGEAIATATLPTQGATSSDPVAWVSAIDKTNYQITLDKDYTQAFKKGDVLNAYYALPPATDKREPSPFVSITSPLPNGLGVWNWICDPDTDKFNKGDIINIEFPGLSLVKAEGSIYTGTDIKSIARYGERAYQMPDNRFIDFTYVEQRVVEYLQEYSQPGYLINMTAPFNKDLSFVVPGTSLLRKVALIDPVMLKSFTDFKISGRIRNITINPNTLQMRVEFRSEEKL